MKKMKWRVASDWIGEGEFEDLDGEVLRTSAYTEPDIGLVVEAFHDDFDYEAWLRNPSWETIAEALEETEE